MARRSIAFAALAGAAALAAIIAVSVVWPGLDARDTPPADTDVWALQTGQGRRYARVNTAVGELDTVRSVSDPSAVTQSGGAAYLFSQSYGKLTRIDQAMPADLDDEALRESPSTPAGTVDVAVAGDFVAYLTDSGDVLAGTLSGGEETAVRPSDADENAPDYVADAIAVDDSGTVFAYSSGTGSVLRYSIPQSKVRGQDVVPSAPGADAEVLLTAAGGVWFLLDTGDGRSWRRSDSGPRTLDLAADAVAGRASTTGDTAWIADQDGVIALPVDGAAPHRAFGAAGAALGTPARPVVRNGTVFAAWLGSGSGTMWRSDSGEHELSYGDGTLSDDRRPVFTGTSSMILNETRIGWVWDARTGSLLPSSQDWELQDRASTQAESSQEQAKVVIDPKPPVAEDDAFGVRPGALATLPVLLNDHDPNEDVLSIDAGSITGLDPDFGRVRVVDQGQRLAISVSPTAHGTATFRYRVSDGTARDGLFSKPAEVTLTVTGDGDDRAPRWCGVEGCLASWPSPQVAPGGTITVPVLDGWVDPESDPVMLLSAVDTSGFGDVAATPDGKVVYQHTDASATQAQTAQVTVTVADVYGRTATRTLAVRIRPDPQVAAESFTVVDTVGGAVTVDASSHVSGTAGRLSLSAVRVLDDAKAEAATASGTAFDFRAEEPGTYRVSYTVTDGDSEASATARITLLAADADAELATAPVVAFVRPQQDVTLDVFSAVTNPTHRVLLLSEVEPSRRKGSTMSVDVVGQRYLRISGNTGDGAPGMLGTISYVVSDGTDDAGASVTGQAGVYMLPEADDVAPIAVDDNVVVRAGSQIDIPVLDNDVAAAGSTMVLNPASVRSSSSSALAFASERTLRYLAPDRPGRYRVEYGVYAAGSVTSADTADVNITVVADDSNRAPRPPTLEGRVLTGQSTTISFHGYGADPDGDPVTLDRVLTQPESGTASVSADGSAIEYSSVAGFHGQVSFTYRVVDARGAAGTATVRVGVLDEKANPSPVTFTDYVQVQVGADASIRVSPLINDVDPSGGTLRITGVRPDAAKTLADGTPNPEYARLAQMIASHGDDHVVIAPGDEASTASFLYDVVSSAGNTAQGLIVVKGVREAVPDYPVISDTQLTAETRERFPDGVDVVAGHVRWSGGDVSDLTLSLWGAPQDVTATGTTIRGPLPERTRIIPFALTGTSVSGTKVTSYGFLRIPGTRDLRLSLRQGTRPQKVVEQDSIGWDMADLVSMPTDAVLEVGRDVSAGGARAEAVCRRGEGTQVRYDAGAGSPWHDSCVVPVRIAGQREWTYVSVPIDVTALDPVPVLDSASLTVSPGATATYDLRDLTAWQGRTDWDALRYDVDYSGTAFRVERKGSTLTVTGADDASPGDEEVAVVSAPSHTGVTPGRLILRVGAAPSQLPKGGTVSTSCSQASGSSCTIAVIGATGELNPLPGTALTVVGVRKAGACEGVDFDVADDAHIRARWTESTPGQTCTVAFTVRDAQGRRSASARDGRAMLDLHGYPKAPASLTQTGYADGALTLRVDPGRARSAYPALTGFRVSADGRTVAQCDADGTCPEISAPNGEKRRYRAVAVNDVGVSRSSVQTTAWAYDAPPAPGKVAASPVVTSGGAGEIVRVDVSGIDSARTARLRLTSEGGDAVDVPVSRGQSRVTVGQYRIGSNTARQLTVTPLSRFDVPQGLDGSTAGTAVSISANGVGAPKEPTLSLSAKAHTDGTATITATASARANGDGSRVRLGIVTDGQTCRISQDGDSASFDAPLGRESTYRMCAESIVDGRSFGRVEKTASITPLPGDVDTPTGYTFLVDAAPHVGENGAQWRITEAPSSSETPPAGATLKTNGWNRDTYGEDPGIKVRYTWFGKRSGWADVTPRPGHAPYQVRVRWSLGVCTGGEDLPTDSNGTDGVDIAFDTAHADYRDADGKALRVPDDGSVPDAAVSVAIDVTATWDKWGLDPAHATLTASCTPAPEPEPTPDPTEDPTPDPTDPGSEPGEGTGADNGAGGETGTDDGTDTGDDSSAVDDEQAQSPPDAPAQSDPASAGHSVATRQEDHE